MGGKLIVLQHFLIKNKYQPSCFTFIIHYFNSIVSKIAPYYGEKNVDDICKLKEKKRKTGTC